MICHKKMGASNLPFAVDVLLNKTIADECLKQFAQSEFKVICYKRYS